MCMFVCVSGKDVNVNALKLSEENWAGLFSFSKHVKKNQKNMLLIILQT